jgi:hypothetical protein
MLRIGKGTLTPTGYRALGRVYPRPQRGEYLIYERSFAQKVPSLFDGAAPAAGKTDWPEYYFRHLLSGLVP